MDDQKTKDVDATVSTCLLLIVRLRADRSSIVVPLNLGSWDCLDLASEFYDQGAQMVGLKLIVTTWRSGRVGVQAADEWTWRLERPKRVTQAERQTKALLETKRKIDAERDRRAALAKCVRCGHAVGAHHPPTVELYGCCAEDCTCEGFSSGLVRTFGGAR